MKKPSNLTAIDPSGLWTWWVNEIRQVIPKSVLRLLDRNKQLLILSTDGTQIAISHLNGSTEELLMTLTAEEVTSDSREKFKRGYATHSETKIALRLRKGQGIRRVVRFPLAAEENLTQVVGLEMDRFSPYRQDQVYFSTRVLERDKDKRQIAAQLVLAPRTLVDQLLELCESGGWAPSIVFLEGEGKPANFNLIPDKFKPKPNRLIETLNLMLASGVLALFILTLILPLWMTKAETSRVQVDLKKATKVAKEAESMREESDRMLQQAKYLQLKKRSEPILVDALEELSRVIPDDTWLNGLQCANHRVVIQGQSPSASSLLKKIESSQYFKDVSFVSPVTKDSSNGLERFQIAFDLVNGRYSEEVH